MSTPSSYFRRLLHSRWTIPIVVLLFQLLMVAPSLMPTFPYINPFDEAKYIISGKQLINLQIRDLAWGPLVGVFYAPLHLLLGRMNDWFMLEAWAGRFMLFALLWASSLSLALEVKRQSHALVFVGVLFVSVPFFFAVANPSDALVASFSALTLGRLLAYSRSGESKQLIYGSIFLGLALLSRAEAMAFVPLFLLIAYAFGRRHQASARTTLFSLLPALGIVALQLALFSLTTGQFRTGFGAKSYDAFEDNQYIVRGVSTGQGIQEARRLFGTPAENHNSVIRAAVRNPSAFAARLIAGLRETQRYFLDAFQKKLGPVTLIFAAYGVLSLLLSRQFLFASAIGLWSIEPFSALLFGPRHVVPQLSCTILVLAGIGIIRVCEANSRLERALSYLPWVALALLGWLGAKLALTVGGLVIIVAITLGELHRARKGTSKLNYGGPLLLLLAAGLILRTPYPFPNFPQLGQTPEEQAIHFLEDHLPPKSLVMSPFPGPALAARMNEVGPGDVPADDRAPASFLLWLKKKGVTAIYQDQRFPESDQVSSLIDSLAGSKLRVAFSSSDGRIRVLLPEP